MDLYRSGIDRDMINLNVDDIIFLEGQEYVIKNALFGPAVCAHVNTMPSPEPFRQAAPFAAVLGYIQNGVQHLQVSYFHVAPRNGKQRLDNFVLLRCNFHAEIIPQLV